MIASMEVAGRAVPCPLVAATPPQRLYILFPRLPLEGSVLTAHLTASPLSQ